MDGLNAQSVSIKEGPGGLSSIDGQDDGGSGRYQVRVAMMLQDGHGESWTIQLLFVDDMLFAQRGGSHQLGVG